MADAVADTKMANSDKKMEALHLPPSDRILRTPEASNQGTHQASFLGGQFSASRHPLDEATEDRQNLSPGQNHSGGSGRRPFSAGLDIELVSKHPRLTEEAVTMIKGLNCQYLPHASNLAESLKVVYESQKQQTSICQKITDLLENEFRAQITTFSQIKMENDETIRDLEAEESDEACS